MQYEPIKRYIGSIIKESVIPRVILYYLLNLLLLRSWHVRKAIRKSAPLLPENANVLDAGSGFGQYSWYMIKRFKKWKITGVDIVREDIDECNSFFRKTGKGENVSFIQQDLVKMKTKPEYDLILTVDVMEHIENDVKVFRNFFNTLKAGGFVVISTPSDKGGSNVKEDGGKGFIDEHVRNGYGKEEIEEKLKKAGFRKTDCRYTYGKAGSLSWVLTMKYPVQLLNKSPVFSIGLPFYYLAVFPLCFFLNLIDLNSRNKTGAGLLVIAEK